jgi:hypothetical protein
LVAIFHYGASPLIAICRLNSPPLTFSTALGELGSRHCCVC